MTTEDQKMPGYVSHLFTAIASCFAAYLLYIGTHETNQATALETAFKQIERQSKEILELRAELVAAQLQIVQLQAVIDRDLSKAEMVRQYLDALPMPAWIKTYRQTDDQFVMHTLNQAYTAKFGFTANYYVGKTDFEVHDNEIAKKYRKADLQVMTSKKAIKTSYEAVSITGEVFQVIVYKFPLDLETGEMAIGGIAISL